ncbi:MAG: hypothetical protein WCG01_04155, partial [bacterium]
DQITQLQADLAAKLAEITTLQSQVTTLEAQISTMIDPVLYQAKLDQIATMTARIIDLEAQLSSASSTNASSTANLQAEIDALKAQIVSLQAQITSPIDPVDYQAKIDQIANLQTQLAAAVASGNNSLAQITILEQQIAQLQKELDTAKKASGGGVIIIDKTDKTAPELSEITVSELTPIGAKISWKTNEPASGFVRYTASTSDREYVGYQDLYNEHFFYLKNLLPNSTYTYQVSSVDGSGNLGQSGELSLETPILTIDPEKTDPATTTATTTIEEKPKITPQLIESAAKNMISLMNNLSQVVSIGTFEKTIITQFDSLEQLARIIPSPVMSGEPSIETTPTTAIIKWNTNKPASSLVAYTPASLYAANKGADNYIQLAGQADELSLNHSVKIIGLKPDSLYHLQLRSKAKVGPEAMSGDFTLKTKAEALEIISYNTEILSPQIVNLLWLTSEETNSQVTIIPYHNNVLSIDDAKTIMNKIYTTNHEMTIEELESGTIYQIEMSGVNSKGKKISKIIPYFSTTKDDLPPEIMQIKTESALSQGKSLKVQTVISWQTNEPTISQVMFGKGVIFGETDLPDATIMESSYGRKHTAIITNFDPGSVYSFRIKATDSGNNTAISNTHTILTPQQKASVFDLIIKNFESTFGWLSNVGPK